MDQPQADKEHHLPAHDSPPTRLERLGQRFMQQQQQAPEHKEGSYQMSADTEHLA